MFNWLPFVKVREKVIIKCCKVGASGKDMKFVQKYVLMEIKETVFTINLWVCINLYILVQSVQGFEAKFCKNFPNSFHN